MTNDFKFIRQKIIAKPKKSHCFILLIAVLPVLADEVVIQSFDSNGKLSFNELSNAINYRIEWAPSVLDGWTNFTGDLGVWMDTIPASGGGVITVSVPMVYRIVATIPPPGMVFIPSGSFMMGNATNVLQVSEGDTNELPRHTVYLNAFYIDKYEVTRDFWLVIRVPAMGYSFSNNVTPTASTRPMTGISWYDAIKWCNARSEVEGLIPCYYTDSGLTNIYKTDQVNPYVNWTANGYRLPTEAEWEKAARGGKPDLRFPWSDYSNKISFAKANYYAGFQSYDLSIGYNPTFGGMISPIGSFPPNDYGVYDMAGNVWEWCWDWYQWDYYSSSPESNPLGPTNGTERILRSGHATEEAFFARCAFRRGLVPGFASDIYHDYGFRCVRNP